MNDRSQKERLEQELRFLKESFEAEVISKEEYEKGKKRIEQKLKGIQNSKNEENNNESKKSDNTDNSIETKEKEKIILLKDEPKKEDKQDKTNDKEQKEPTSETTEVKIDDEKKENKLAKYAIIFIVLALIIFFSYSIIKPDDETQNQVTHVEITDNVNIINDLEFDPLCRSDEDCRQDGKEGFCSNPRTLDAKCEFKDIVKTNVVVINDRKNCFNCDTQRVLGILENWFDEINVEEIDYNKYEGRTLAESVDARLLPVYILDENVTLKPAFEQFKQAFIQKDGMHVLSENAAGSSYYFDREEVPNKLDIFIIEGDTASKKAQDNLKEFLDAFKDVDFDRHLSEDKFAKELGIKTFPTFLVNNKVKFSGIHPADTIKNNFCSLNKLEDCDKGLSKSLV